MKYIVYFLIIMGFFGCSKYQPDPTNSQSTISVSIPNATGSFRADNVTITQVFVNKSIDSLDDSTKVYFQSNKGTILFSPVEFIQRQAIGYLKFSEDTGLYFITILIEKNSQVLVEKDTNIEVLAARPDSIEFERDKYKASTSSPVTIQIYLHRNVGLVSKGQTINLTCYQIDSQNTMHNVGRFQGAVNNYSDSTGKLSSILFYSDTEDIDTTRNVVIVAQTNNDNGNVVKDSIILGYQ